MVVDKDLLQIAESGRTDHINLIWLEGCVIGGTVGRAVASDVIDLRYRSSHRHFFFICQDEK